ncbi:MAG: hypothetical protein RMI56_03815 [Sulfolobales archaeon]|nr:hypothetical protein [Sulfolobales archaeon]MDW8082909.1 hypothetical protein [Sulfolobales archaeon]
MKVLVHAYCRSSYQLVKHLLDRGLQDELEIVPLNPENPVFLRRVVPSVPALVIGRSIVAIDPLEPEFVESVLLGRDLRTYVPVDEGEIVERFVKSAKFSSYVMLHTLLGGLNLEDVVDTEFARAAVRTYFTGLSDAYVRNALLARSSEVGEELSKSSVKSTAHSFLRDMWVAFGGIRREFISYKVLKLWFTAKISQGVAYTPIQGLGVDEKIGSILKYLEENYDAISKSIEAYVSILTSDREVYRILTQGNKPALTHTT